MPNNLLIAESALARVEASIAELPDIRILALAADGTVIHDGSAVSLDFYPVELAWLSQELLEEGSIRHFSRIVMDAPQLRWMQTVSAGLDHPMFKQLIERGVRLCNSDAQAPAIAEYVAGAVLYRYQAFPSRAEKQRQSSWEPVPFRQMYGSNWLIVGFGNIGQRVGRIARSFDANVVGVKRRDGDHPDADRIITFADLPAHLPDADVVVIACALTDDTRDLVDADFLSRLRSDCVLVNIARGDIVDETALLSALDSNALDYAVLDVFREEPLPKSSPFWTHENVHVTPHASNRGNATRPLGVALFLGNLEAVIAGRPLRNEVDLSFFDA